MAIKKYTSFFIDLICVPFLWALRFIFSLTKRKENIWIFSSWNGLTFSDNAKYLFLYAHKYEENIDVFWITRSNQLYKELKELELPVLYIYSLGGILKCLKAGVQLTTHGIYDLSPILTKGSIHVALFHASFPLKKMEFDAFDTSIAKQCIRFIRKPFVFEKADYSISSSRKTQSVIGSAHRIPTNKVLISGYPRSDFINSKNHTSLDESRIKSLCDLERYSHFIYFVPTFRNNPEFDIFEHGFNQELLIEFLEETNSVLIFRFHPFEHQKVMRHRNIKHQRIIFENHGLDDPYPLLSKCSVLITDFSSIFADYLLMDKPIIFANFDQKGYLERERELYWNYEDVTPGVKVQNWCNLIDELRKVVTGEKDLYHEERMKMKEVIYLDVKEHFSEKAFRQIKNAIQDKINK